jgi:hypothetical protein
MLSVMARLAARGRFVDVAPIHTVDNACLQAEQNH